MKQDALMLNRKIKELEEVKQFLILKKKIEEDAFINQLLAKIKQTQKLMNTSLKNNKIKEYNNYKKELEILKIEFNENPLIQNYYNYQQDVNNILLEIASIIAVK